MRQQRFAQPGAAVRGLHVEVFQVQPRLAQEGAEVGEEEREGDHLPTHFGHHGLGCRPRAEKMRVQ